MEEILHEIDIYLSHNLSDTNIERVQTSKDEYSKILKNILEYILEVKYQDLIKYLDTIFIDNMQNLESYAKNLLGLYLSHTFNYGGSSKSILNKNQNFIFWHDNNKLFKYTSLYAIDAIQKYTEENFIIFYRNKKSDKLPLASIVNTKGEEQFSIDFPEKEDNECVNGNISFYYGGVGYENSILIMDAVFTNGACRMDFWCKYDLGKRIYIASDLSY